MTPHATNAFKFSKASELLGQMGEEMAFLVPDLDSGLLPINGIVMDLEELAEAGAPASFSAAINVARQWLNGILDGTGKFTADSIQKFNEWHEWVSGLLAALEEGEAVPDAPAAWGMALKSAGAATQAAAPSASVESVIAEDSQGSEPAILLNLSEDLDLLREFHSESLELLQNIEQGLLVLEEKPKDSTTINSIFRAFHTFKGGAGFLHLDAMRDLAHELESLLDAVRRSELQITSGIIDLVLAGADALKKFTREIGAQLQDPGCHGPIIVPTSQLIRRLKAALKGEVEVKCAPELVAQVPVVPVVEAVPPPATPVSPSVPSPKPPVVAVPCMDPPPAAVVQPAPIKQGSEKNEAAPLPATAKETSGSGAASSFVKLDTSKLDNLVDLVGELVIAQSMVVQNPDVSKINSLALARALRQLSRITTELQRNAMSLRMVPIRGTFNKMSRLVRDLAAHQQKQVQLELAGEDTELDRNIVEKLGDALVHMIRNSVDHGIELPADRVAQGKAPQGTVRLSASHQRGGIVIRIEDDGRGLNRDRILAKALERGLIKPNADLTDSEIYSLIFLPGFSTAEKITDVSGRGVGMDVVQRNIENLRGSIETHSVLGEGTTFTILLPLTLAIIDGLLVGIGEDRYIIPTLSVRESFRPRPGMVTTVHERGEIVSVRGRQTPLLRLGQYLGSSHRATTPEEGIIVVVESGDAARGLLVDELIGKQEVVIKSLGETFQGQNLLAGAAVLGDGWVGLILDVDTLVKLPNPQRVPKPAAPTLN